MSEIEMPSVQEWAASLQKSADAKDLDVKVFFNEEKNVYTIQKPDGSIEYESQVFTHVAGHLDMMMLVNRFADK